MQIVIPMSGFGERFRRAGYEVPKPLIEVEGKPIIAHVVDMFPGESDFTFICNQEHLDNPTYRMKEILTEYCPFGRIVGIPPHKLGPVYAVQQIVEYLDDTRPVIVNYCDFTCYWDWANFKKFVTRVCCAGAIPAYKGFHPHSLGNTNYAYVKEDDGWIQDIQEKQPYTDNRMDEYASSGTYYFASARIMMEAFDAIVDQGNDLNGEYYVSLAYKHLLFNNMPVAVYPLQHFMQWGTPGDVSEYNSWSKAFKKLLEPSTPITAPRGAFVVPMAGLGQRFAEQGYEHTKPLIPVSGRSMVLQAANDLPSAASQAFVLRSDMTGYKEVSGEIRKHYPDCIIKSIDSVTKGQAITAGIGLDALREQGKALDPITFAACDNGALYEIEDYDSLIDDPLVDIVVWCVRGYPNAVRKPEMFGWVDVGRDGLIRKISVKTPLNSPETDPIAIGTFTFKKSEHFSESLKRLIARNGLINGEFYIDSLINDAIDLGLRCKVFEIDSYLCWGTPNDLKTFEYWQSCFHKWASHPYRLELDARVPREAVPSFDLKCNAGYLFMGEAFD
ncbi:MAG: NDP-sugar pyrophosphorylase family protein [Gammaproteobacteria bacterium]|jgi:NDP-sugar pyrophosphorylase family protein